MTPLPVPYFPLAILKSYEHRGAPAFQAGSFDAGQFSLFQGAYQRYGKGRHPAALNFGNCLSYAAAKSRGSRLLYVGEDFAQTAVA